MIAAAHAMLVVAYHLLTRGTAYHELGDDYCDRRQAERAKRRAFAVRIANFAQLVNAIAPIFTGPGGLFLQTIYHPLRLYAEHTREVALDVHVTGETHDLTAAQEARSAGRLHHVADLGPFALLDAAATADAAGRLLTLTVVNRDRDRDHAAPSIWGTPRRAAASRSPR